ncbi:MAG: hypothetical protein ACKVPX_13780 [Myxococcaceae bacterium]
MEVPEVRMRGISLRLGVVLALGVACTPSMDSVVVQGRVLPGRDPAPLVRFVKQIPAVNVLANGEHEDGRWWIRIGIDLNEQIAWSVVQQLAFVLNQQSAGEQLPTLFMPVSLAPAVHGGPAGQLNWVIESREARVDPEWIARVLDARLPRPVNERERWLAREPSVDDGVAAATPDMAEELDEAPESRPEASGTSEASVLSDPEAQDRADRLEWCRKPGSLTSRAARKACAALGMDADEPSIQRTHADGKRSTSRRRSSRSLNSI